MQGHRLRQVAHVHARQHRQSGTRPHTGDLDQLAEGLALGAGGKAVEDLRVFAHHKVGEQRDLVAIGRQVVEGAHGHLHLVAHAAAVDDDLRWIFVADDACEFADHGAESGVLEWWMASEATVRIKLGTMQG